MRSLWKGVVVAGAMFWVFVGTFAFYTNLQNEGTQFASAAYFWQKSAPAQEDEILLDGPYVHEVQSYDLESADESVDIEEPWYMRMMPGIGVIARNLIQGAAPRAASPLMIQDSSSAPTCSITVSPSNVPYGGRAIVTWISHGAQNAVLQGVGSVAPSSAYAANSLTSTRSYVLAVSGRGGVGTCNTTVSVMPLIEKNPTCVISVRPSIIKNGESASLSWGSTNASSATLSNFGDVETTGGARVNPSKSTSYILGVSTLSGRSSTCETTLEVE